MPSPAGRLGRLLAEEPDPQIRQRAERGIMGRQPLGIPEHDPDRTQHGEQRPGGDGGTQQQDRHVDAGQRQQGRARQHGQHGHAQAEHEQRPLPAPEPQDAQQRCHAAPARGNDPAVPQVQPPSAEAECRRRVARHHHRAAHRKAAQAVDHVAFCRRVQMGGRLVQQQQRRVLQEGAGDRHPLGLPTGQAIAAFADHGVQTVRQGVGERDDAGAAGGSLDLLVRGVGAAEPDVLPAGCRQTRWGAGRSPRSCGSARRARWWPGPPRSPERARFAAARSRAGFP